MLFSFWQQSKALLRKDKMKLYYTNFLEKSLSLYSVACRGDRWGGGPGGQPDGGAKIDSATFFARKTFFIDLAPGAHAPLSAFH